MDTIKADIKAFLLKNNSKQAARKLAKRLIYTPNDFKVFMKLFFDGPYRITQRATVPLELCVKEDTTILTPYLTKLVAILYDHSSDQSVKRSILRTLQYIDIPTKHRARLLNICFQFLSGSETPIAIKVFSMTIAANISSKLPEIKKELRLMIDERMPYESAGFVARGRRIVKQLLKN